MADSTPPAAGDATDATPETPKVDGTPATTPDAEAEDEARTRLPRVVVRMSDAMKAALDEWLTAHPGSVATAIARELLAKHIGYDLTSDPDAPGSGTRTKYADDTAREAGKTRNRKKASLLRQALFHMHQAGLKKRPALLQVALATVTALSDDKIDLPAIEAQQAKLEEAVKAGK